MRILFRKNPFIQCVCIKFTAEITFKILLLISLKNNFSRIETLQQFVRIFFIAFGNKKFTGRNIEKGNSCFLFNDMKATQKIILIVLEQFIIGGNSRSNQFSN